MYNWITSWYWEDSLRLLLVNSVFCFRESTEHSEGCLSGYPDSQHQSSGQLLHWWIHFNVHYFFLLTNRQRCWEKQLHWMKNWNIMSVLVEWDQLSFAFVIVFLFVCFFWCDIFLGRLSIFREQILCVYVLRTNLRFIHFFFSFFWQALERILSTRYLSVSFMQDVVQACIAHLSSKGEGKERIWQNFLKWGG